MSRHQALEPVRQRCGWLLGAALVVAGCQSQEQAFTEGRLEDLCAGAIPICALKAACVLDTDEFVRGTFPGAQRLIAVSDLDRQSLRVRLLLTEMVFPGTELEISVFSLGCGRAETEQRVDVDLFELAGDDRTLEFSFPLDEKGDHLVEVFSDMSAEYVLTFDLID
jgi:hypothetical protein